jgi:tetratricopeptide (TPR) repeat protein
MTGVVGEAAPVLGASSNPSRSSVPLYGTLGTLHHPVTTTSDLAQRYFDQGLRLVYAFNYEEAARAFEEAARLDPSAAMPYWGIALALGPTTNAPLSKEQERRAAEALHQARARLAHASEVERRYIEALSLRYDPKRGARTTGDRAYANAMRALWRDFPHDADAGVLFAAALMNLRPWDLWVPTGKPQSEMEEIVSILEAVLARFPDHPGACHYYIHAVEASPIPERALTCAERLPRLVPGAGHLVHMPAHIYMRLGRYHEATERNAHAVLVDREYLSGRTEAGEYTDASSVHHLYFLWASLLMEGRKAESLRVGRQLTALIGEIKAQRAKWKEWYLPAPLWSMIRFGQWNELLHEPAPGKELRLHHGIWRLGRGLALAATDRLPEAEAELAVLSAATKQVGHVRTEEDKIERAMINIAERLLAGEIASRLGNYRQAIVRLKEALAIEDNIPSPELPLWPIPIRHYLGAALLAAGRPSEAEAVYQADLTKNPHNGWALMGLVQSLRAQDKTHEADEAERRLRVAWTHAEVPLAGSRF